jgi:hypothetical protein
MEIAELIALMKREKVLVAKLGGLHVELHPSAFVTPEDAPKDDPKAAPMPTDEEFMVWSLPESSLERDEPRTES